MSEGDATKRAGYDYDENEDGESDEGEHRSQVRKGCQIMIIGRVYCSFEIALGGIEEGLIVQ